jgi:hypothetical protein
MLSRTAEPGAKIEQRYSGAEIELGCKVLGSGLAAYVELVNGREIIGLDVISTTAHRFETGQNLRLQAAMGVVPRDLLFERHAVKLHWLRVCTLARLAQAVQEV